MNHRIIISYLFGIIALSAIAETVISGKIKPPMAALRIWSQSSLIHQTLQKHTDLGFH